MMYFRKSTTFLMTAAALLTIPVLAFSQGTTGTGADSGEVLEELIVTGTSKARISADTPMSTTQLNADKLGVNTYSGQADFLRLVPGIKAEGGGGEVATNVFVRGLPSGGQFAFNPLLYDGMPAISTFGLNSSADDVYYRPDFGVERMEFVRGGVSNLFGTGSVAGLINYISKQGSDTPATELQVEVADESRARFDFANSGPLSKDSGLYYAVSGFYRYDEGPLDTGFPTEGYQLRANIRNEFDDGSGSITFFGQVIDDQVQFFLPFPLDGQSLERTAGNDGSGVKTVQTSEAGNLNYQTPGGTFRTPIRDGVSTEGGSFAVAIDKDLGDGWGINTKVRYADYDHQFNLFLDGDGVVNTVETQAEFLANRGLGAIADANFTFTESGRTLQPTDLLFANRLLDRNRPATDFSAEVNFTKVLSTGSFEHNFTFGSFFSRTEADDDDVITTYLGEFNDRPDLVSLTVTDTVGGLIPGSVIGDDIIVSNNGLTNPGVSFSNITIEGRRLAGYIADQMDSDRWIIDVGFRIEQMIGDVNREGSSSFFVPQVAGQDPATLLHPNLENIAFGDGSFAGGRVRDTEWAGSVGALFKLNDTWNIYGNASRGYFFPQLRSVRISKLGDPTSYEAEEIIALEIGAKFSSDRFAATGAVFYNELSDRANVDFINDPNNPGGVIEVASLQDTESIGVEVTGTVFINDWLTFDGNVTWQDHELTENSANPAFEGNELRRQPNWLANGGVYFDGWNFDAALTVNYVGENFTDDSNLVELDDFDIWNFDVGYTFNGFSDDSKLRFSLHVFNLFDDEGVTEGSPRQGSLQQGGAAFFIGRPILPQRVTVRVNYSF